MYFLNFIFKFNFFYFNLNNFFFFFFLNYKFLNYKFLNYKFLNFKFLNFKFLNYKLKKKKFFSAIDLKKDDIRNIDKRIAIIKRRKSNENFFPKPFKYFYFFKRRRGFLKKKIRKIFRKSVSIRFFKIFQSINFYKYYYYHSCSFYKNKNINLICLKDNLFLIEYKYYFYLNIFNNLNMFDNFKIKKFKNIIIKIKIFFKKFEYNCSDFLIKKFFTFKTTKTVLFKFNKIKKLNFIFNKFSWFFYFNFLPRIFFYFIFKKNLKKKKSNFFLNKNILVRLFKNNKRNFNAPFFFNFFNFFLKNFGEFFLKKKILINFFIIKKIVLKLRKKFLFKIASNKLYRYFKKFKKKLKFSTAFDIVWLTFLFKDVSFFLKWFIRSIKKIRFNDFRRYIHFIKMLFKFFFSMKLNFFGCEGISFFIKGKFGIKGNAKKKKIFFKFGKSSFSKKKIKINFEQKQIFTKTGVLGFGFFIYF